MRESAWPWGFLSLLVVLSLVSAVVPVAAQDQVVDSWQLELPRTATPGTTLSITGRTPDGCVAGTAEIGWDPNFDQYATDGRSGGQVGITVPNGDFSVELPIPSTAQGGTLYGTCEWSTALQGVYLTTASSLVTDGAPNSDPGNQGGDATPDRDPDTGSSEPVITDDLFRFQLNPGTAALTGTGGQASGWPVGAEVPFVVAAGPDGLTNLAWVSADADLQAVRLPKGANCHVTTCLWGYFAPPYFNCNQTVVVTNFGRSRYGSMTGYSYVRKGTADYIKARPFFYQDGVLIKTGKWEKKSFFHYIGQPWESWYALRIHQQFASPQSIYQVGFQVQWYRHKPLRRDVLLAQSPAVSPVPYTCTAGP